MLNLLIAEDNMQYVKSFINYIIGQTQDVKITNIATNGEEVIDIVSKGNIDLLTLDLKLPKYDGIEVINQISKMKHLSKMPQIIVVSGDIELMNKIRNNPLVIDSINKADNLVSIYKRIQRVSESKVIDEQRKTVKKKVMNELLYIGFNPKHRGTHYILESILYIYEQKDRRLLEQLEKNVYKRIACIHNKSEKNIKDNIRNATEFMYIETKSEVLKEYFLNNTNNSERKPTPKIVISTILEKI